MAPMFVYIILKEMKKKNIYKWCNPNLDISDI